MVLREEDLKILREVPAENWHILMHLANYLAEEHKKLIHSGKKRSKPRLLGALEGKVWISDDFNDPMDFVSKDEMRVLEAMRARNENESKAQEATKQEAVI